MPAATKSYRGPVGRSSRWRSRTTGDEIRIVGDYAPSAGGWPYETAPGGTRGRIADDVLRETYEPASICGECGVEPAAGGRCFPCRGASMAGAGA